MERPKDGSIYQNFGEVIAKMGDSPDLDSRIGIFVGLCGKALIPLGKARHQGVARFQCVSKVGAQTLYCAQSTAAYMSTCNVWQLVTSNPKCLQ